MSVNIYDPNTGQLQKIAGLLGNENIGIPKAGTYTSDANSNADNIKALDTALVNINQAVSNVAGNISDNNDEYDPNHNYAVGEYCISPEDGTLQKCIVATSGGSWATVKDTCFEKDTLTNVVETLNSELSDISTDATNKTVIWQDLDIAADLSKNVSFTMPRDGYVIATLGAANNDTIKLLNFVIYANNVLIAQMLLSAQPYAYVCLSTPCLKKGTNVKIGCTLKANSWPADKHGRANVSII